VPTIVVVEEVVAEVFIRTRDEQKQCYKVLHVLIGVAHEDVLKMSGVNTEWLGLRQAVRFTI
jgi:hypothetical protein